MSSLRASRIPSLLKAIASGSSSNPAVSGCVASRIYGSDMTLLDAPDSDRDLTAEPSYPRWPTLKRERALQHSAALSHLYSTYTESLGPTTTLSYGDDGYATVRARVAHRPSAYQWSLVFGDIIHNYRASLDALTWAVAHLDGREPSNPSQIQFPITKSASEWVRLSKKAWFNELPRFVKDRLHDVQPYRVPDPANAVADVLHQLDIKDKHHESLAISVFARSGQEMPVVFESDEPDAIQAVADTAEYPHRPGPIEDGDIVFRIKLDGRAQFKVAPELPLRLTTTLNGETLDVWHLLRTIDAQVALTLASVESGQGSRRFQMIRSAMED